MLNKFQYLALVSTFGVAVTAFASTTTTSSSTNGNMNVYLTVLKACTVSVSDMNFGEQYSNAGDQTTDATASVVCTQGTDYRLTADAAHDYVLNDGNGNKVAYKLYTDQAGQVPMTTGTTETGTGAPQQLKIYGKIAASSLQQAPAGKYKDTVSILVDY
ncbi:spore coat protein U domain-containing protein [Providencia sp. SP181]|uniref:spore coat protein U domain-containing protein n=1 Tax=Providencia sp. SP181 TaxID=3136277 RepID=UPI003D2C48F8